MGKIRKYQRWPRNEETLQKRLTKICHQIDNILKKDFPYEVLFIEKGQKLYEKSFRKLFLQAKYRYDSTPTIVFSYGHVCCSPAINFSFHIRNREGEKMKC